MMHRIYVDGMLRERRKDPPSREEITKIERVYNASMRVTTHKSSYSGLRRIEHTEYIFETGRAR